MFACTVTNRLSKSPKDDYERFREGVEISITLVSKRSGKEYVNRKLSGERRKKVAVLILVRALMWHLEDVCAECASAYGCVRTWTS